MPANVDDFIRMYKGKYGYGECIEDIRKKEFARIKGERIRLHIAAWIRSFGSLYKTADI